MVEIEILEKTDGYMRFIVKGVNVPLVNALRRIMLTEVPAMAIDELVILENSSMLNDEILAHRMGLIPLKTDLDSYNLPEECGCKSEFGCNLCRLTLTLEAEATEKTITVYSRDLKSENPDVTPVSEKIPIVKLALEQKIKLEAYARLGKGKDHAKWQPVSMCTYKYLPQVKIDLERCNACAECVELCPERVLVDMEEGIKTQNVIECTLCMDCVDACPQNPPAVEISWDKEAFVFEIESTGALPAERIVLEALKILDKKIKDLSNQLKKGRKSEES
ncbi:MAG: DNA-directed RNA polymerase subunit D [Candidatus Bathyarchaeota archaeon]|nr:DNA-directed RNA polymerase subunit D [Candidatus Bathyarchaeota archaeon]MDH5702524.1 DNA-directed RNA polymerase subunit D [Candidatus Bathyarchaeota archaeon]